MKILQIIQRDQLRGAEIFACQLSEHLTNMDVKVDVLVLFGNCTGNLNYTGKIIYLNASEKWRLLDYIGLKKISRLINLGQYDVIQANSGDTIKYAVFSKILFNWDAKLIYRNANKASEFIDTYLKKTFYRLLLSKVDYVASVSVTCMNDFIKLFGIKNNRIKYLPIGVEVFQINKQYNVNALQISNKYPILIHVAGFVQEKNHLGLLRIFSKILYEYPEAILLLVGTGPILETIIRASKDLGIDKNVQFLGSRKDVKDLLRFSNVFVLPSLIEGLPAVILEAFAFKVPVVAYDVGGIREIVKNKQTGFLINKNDENQFADSVLEIIKHKPEIIIENAYNSVFNEFRLEAVTKRFYQFYNDIIP